MSSSDPDREQRIREAKAAYDRAAEDVSVDTRADDIYLPDRGTTDGDDLDGLQQSINEARSALDALSNDVEAAYSALDDAQGALEDWREAAA